MPAQTGELASLLRALRTAGPLERVRLLAKSAGMLRGLTPVDRKVLLKMAGFDGAEALVEKLAHEDRRTSRALRRLLGKLEENPAAASNLGRALADPRRRGAAIDDLVSGLEEALTEDAEPEAEAPDPRPTASPEAESPEATAAPGQTAAAEPPPAAGPSAPGVPPTPPPAEPGTAAARAEPAPPLPAPSSPGIQAPPTPTPAPDPPPKPSPPPPVAPRLSSWNDPAARWDVAAPAAVVPPPARPSPSLAPSRPEAGPGRSLRSALRELRALRARLATGEPLGAAALAPWVDGSVPAWLGRRALQSWLAALPPAELGPALQLVDDLPSPTARFWCLATLAEARRWSGAQSDEILDHAPSPASRRRLALRRARDR